MNTEALLEQHRYFHTGATLPAEFRLAMPDRLRSALDRYEPELPAP